MVRRTAALFSFVMAAATALVLGATLTPATAADSGPVVAGTYTGQLVMTKTDPAGMSSLATKPGARTFAFGAGCGNAATCTLTLTSPAGTHAQSVHPGSAGATSWSGTESLNCYDTVTNALRLKDSGTYRFDVHLRPAATKTVAGTTYVTGLAGTYKASIVSSPAGVAQHCTLFSSGKYTASESGRYTLTLAPLAAPRGLPQSPPLAVSPGTTPAATSIPGFTLPQSARQRASALAVASGHRSSVPGALVEPTDALKSVGSRLPRDLLLVALLGLLMIFPAQLFNSTYEENHERIDRRLGKLRIWRRRRVDGSVDAEAAAPASRVRRLSIFFGCALVGTLMAGFLDPKFGATTASYALVTGVFVSVLVTVLVVVLAGRVYRSLSHHETGWFLEAIPSALIVAGVCVLVSRLTHFQPGYLYGVLGGAVFVAALDRRGEGRAEVTASVVGLGLALVAWVVFEPVAHAATKPGAGYPTLALDSLLACLFIGGLEGMLFGLVPLRFLPGARIKNWSWVAWALLTAVVAYLFVHVLLMPESGYLGRSTAASVTTTIVLFVAFGVASALFWGYFRWRPTPEVAEEQVGADAAIDPGPPAVPNVGSDVPAPARVPVDSQGDVVSGTTQHVPQQPGAATKDQS